MQVEQELAKERAGLSGRSVDEELLDIRARHHSEDEVLSRFPLSPCIYIYTSIYI